MSGERVLTRSKFRALAGPLGARRRPIVAVLLAAAALRALLLVASADAQPKIVDERHYLRLAGNIADGHGFATAPGRPTSMRPPLFPALIAGLWTATGTRSLLTVRTAQAVISLLTVWLVFLLGRALAGERAGLIAAAIVAFYPSLLFSNVLVLTEPLFTGLLVAFALAYVRYLRTDHLAVAAGAGALLACAALTRSVMWPFPLLLAPLTLMAGPGTLPRRAQAALVLVLACGVVIAPWALRNTRLQGVFTVVDTMGGMNLRMGNYEHTPEDRMWSAVAIRGEQNWSYELKRLYPDGITWTDGQKEKWAARQALAYMWANPGLTLRRSAIKFADFWGLERDYLGGVRQGLYRPSRGAAFAIAAVTTGAYIALTILAVLAVFLVPPDDWRGHAVLVGIMAFICAVHTVVFGHPRYHLPLVPLLAVYAATAIDRRAWRGARARVPALLAPAAAVCLLLFIWTRQVVTTDAARIRELMDKVG